MHRLTAIVLVALLAPLALAQRDPTFAIGDATIEMGQGCHDVSNCHPEEYAWVAASACVATPGTVLLEVERILHDAPPVLAELHSIVTGDLSCPYRATGFVELWSSLVDMPVDCLRASVIAPAGVVATRLACFSDL